MLERVVELVHAPDGRHDGPDERRPVGVVVMAYGTPASPADIEPYYTHIRRGRPPTPELLAELTARYDAIGGISPLAQRTEAQRDAIAAALDAAEPGRVRGRGSARSTPHRSSRTAWPRSPTTGVDRVVGLVLAPHYSGFSVGQYHERAGAAAAEAGRASSPASTTGTSSPPSWTTRPASVRDAAGRPARAAPRWCSPPTRLPERVLVDDPYPDELRASAAAIAERGRAWAGGPDWGLGWQTAGRTPEPWRGPDILDVIRDLAGTGRSDGILVCPRASPPTTSRSSTTSTSRRPRIAAEVGLAFARTDVVNDDPAVMAALPAGRGLAGEVDHDQALVVVGGGITGLAAAWEAVGRAPRSRCWRRRSGSAARSAPRRSTLPDGPVTIDEGADAFLARVPEAVDLCRELGLDAEFTQPASGRAKVYVDGELRFFPTQHVLGVPLDPQDLADTGILSEQGLQAAGAEVDLRGPAPDRDVAIGPYLAEHFGRELVDHVVGPLVGGINAGDVERAEPGRGDTAAGRGRRRRRQPHPRPAATPGRRPPDRAGVPRPAQRDGDASSTCWPTGAVNAASPSTPGPPSPGSSPERTGRSSWGSCTGWTAPSGSRPTGSSSPPRPGPRRRWCATSAGRRPRSWTRSSTARSPW